MKFKLDKEVKKRWLKALRSGEYQQDKSGHLCSLEDENDLCTATFCCLGVYADIELDGFWEFQSKYGGYEEKIYKLHLELENGNEQEYWYFLPEEIIPHDIQERLAKMNDDPSWSFEDIADWIEKNL